MFYLFFGILWFVGAIIRFVDGDFNMGIIGLLLALLHFKIYGFEKKLKKFE